MNTTTRYIGIDLGTSNSAVSYFEAGEVKPILNSRGEVNNPSVVRVTETGISVGEKAKKHLYSDPKNTFKEFKRLLGTQSLSSADCRGKQWQAEELSAEVLKYLKAITCEQLGGDINKAVITVPALFEIPQSKATAEAARLAGFEQVELLPEPVASGLAAGWSQDHAGQAWLVYDLGGGTFDVSLLETRDGLLRVVGHDGDNFLGGRDIDRKIVQWIFQQLEQQHSLKIDQHDAQISSIQRHFEDVAEATKIRLSNTEHSVLELDFDYQGEHYEYDIAFNRNQLSELCVPLIQRSIDICLRLLQKHGLEKDKLARVVLVGGPANMPIIQQAVTEQLAPLAEGNGDPMALVSKGAALYAATINLGCESSQDESANAPLSNQLWLQYPSVCSELNPMILGRVVDPDLALAFVKISDQRGHFNSDFIAVDDNLFMTELAITAGDNNRFNLHGFDANKQPLEVRYSSINIVHGLNMSDPPLARTISVALADGNARSFIERGTPLPAKRTFMQSTVSPLEPGSNEVMTIPIVQGERKQSRFCRKVGSLNIEAAQLKKTLPVGSAIEITIEVDRGGDLKAQALIVDQGIIIEGVANLMMETSSLANLRASAHSLNNKLSQRIKLAFSERQDKTIAQLNPLVEQIQPILAELDDNNTDDDSCHRIARILVDIEATFESIESQDDLIDLIHEVEQLYYYTSSSVAQWGNETEKQILADCNEHMASAFRNKRKGELERLHERLQQLNYSARKNNPAFWCGPFEHWASFAHASTDPKRSDAIIKQGREAIANKDYSELEKLTSALFSCIPQQYKNLGQPGSHESGIY
ncbi:Hsp70 family protein [Reinekea thalattae]|uniref:Hsp70 family protein n=1 Tax=Reinekea thalattae TaxID=2593301 RepID=A0A5C8YZU1_9GAMM|nr:Hsp70 family protein [Reinekea thalattae]TXR51392.1 Hsp70 family protein [Reinekea thalattae]